MSDPRCSTYNCERSMVTRMEGRPYCQQCVTSFLRGLADGSTEILEHLDVLKKYVIHIGLGGDK